MPEPTEKVQINFQLDANDAIALDALARADGYDKRASWIRRTIRTEIGRRLSATVTTLPHAAGEQPVPLVTLRDDGPDPLAEAIPA